MVDLKEILQILPLILVGAGILISLVLEMYSKRSEKILPWLSIIIFLSAGVLSLLSIDSPKSAFNHMISAGGNTHVFYFIFTAGAALGTLLSIDYIKKYGTYYGEYYILIQSSVLGMMLMSGAKDLLVIFLGLELMSVSFYVLAGFSFKIAAFPFHMWVPDVYQGSPTTIAGLFSTGGKAAAFSSIIITLIAIFSNSAQNVFAPYLSVIATLSMLFGSIVAIAQEDIKRMLAYSSIAHAGYLTIGLAAGNQDGVAGILFYLAAS